MDFAQPTIAGGFKAGPIDMCQICHNRSELAQFDDGRMICNECWDIMTAGKQRNIESGRVVVEPQDSLPPVNPTQIAQTPAVAWQSTDSGERSFYLSTIKSAKKEIITKVINNLVNSGVLHLDFHKIIQNERWFSIIDLRKIASEVDPDFENPMPIPPKKVSAKPRRKKCQNQSSIPTPKVQQPEESQQPNPRQLELPLQFSQI